MLMQAQAHIAIHPNGLDTSVLQLVAIVSSMNGGWLWVRNKNRYSWELPGGHIEPGESPVKAANRELYEETGAIRYSIRQLFDYTVQLDGAVSYGRMFYAEVTELAALPKSEIAEVKVFKSIPEDLTYKRVQPRLFEIAIDYLK